MIFFYKSLTIYITNLTIQQSIIMSLMVCKCYHDSQLPIRATSGSVGYDLMSYENIVLPAGRMAIVKTGIKVKPPEGTYIRLAARSSFASKGIHVNGGVIDPDYTGEIKVILHNLSDLSMVIKRSMKIAQMIVEKVEIPDVIEMSDISHCSERGEKGFGSSDDLI